MQTIQYFREITEMDKELDACRVVRLEQNLPFCFSSNVLITSEGSLWEIFITLLRYSPLLALDSSITTTKNQQFIRRTCRYIKKRK